MALLIDLPVEVLEMIFHYLGTIDDVHLFGRTCTKTAGVIERQTTYTNIMRSVVTRASQHRYDAQLYWILKFHGHVVCHFQNDGGILPATQSNVLGYELNDWEKYLFCVTVPQDCKDTICAYCLPDQMVHDILARYQGLRVLENLWLERQLGDYDYISVDDTSDPDDFSHAYNYLISRHQAFRDQELAPRSSPESADYTTLKADQRARFHAAVTCIWLLNEIRWALTNFTYPIRFDVQVRLLEMCKAQIVGLRREELLDELDQQAMFKFIYHHLLPLHGLHLADNKVPQLPFTFASDFKKDVAQSSRLLQLFLTAGQTYLQPGDMIELIARVEASRKYPYPIPTFSPSTVQWQRPSTAFAFPLDATADLWDQRYKGWIQQTSLNHLNIIVRSSFHQTTTDYSSVIRAPTHEQMYKLKDLAHYYYHDRAMVAFELHENKGAHLRYIREVFPRKWGDESWAIWWWANGEDKARAKMERWRREPRTASARRRAM